MVGQRIHPYPRSEGRSSPSPGNDRHVIWSVGTGPSSLLVSSAPFFGAQLYNPAVVAEVIPTILRNSRLSIFRKEK